MIIKHILVPIDFSDEAFNGLRVASRLAIKFNSLVNLVHFILPEEVGERPEQEVKDQALKQLKDIMNRRVHEELQGAVYVVLASSTDSFEEFLMQVEIDLVVSVASETKDILSIFNGNSKRILKKANIPVFALSDEEEISLQDIIISWDRGEVIPERMFEVCRFLQDEGSAFHFVTVVDPGVETEKEVVEALKKLTVDERIKAFYIHIKRNVGKVESVLEVAKDTRADLILMKTYPNEDFWTFLSVNLAEKTVSEPDIH